MLKHLGLFALGAALGAVGAAAWFQLPDRDAAAPSAAPIFLADGASKLLSGGTDSAAPVSTVAESLAIYRGAAASSRESLEASLADLAAAPYSPARDLEIDALLARLADLDPRTAAAFVLQAGLDRRFVVRAFQLWAETDVQAAMTSLGRIGDARTRRDAALGLLDVLGGSAAEAERIESLLPGSEQTAFRLARLERRASENPYRAFRDAQTMRDQSRRQAALSQVAAAWAEQDPIAALSQARTLPDRERALFRNAVADTWAKLDPTGYLAYLQSGAANPDELTGGLRWLTAADPDALLRAAESLPGTAGRSLRQAAIRSLAEQDPDGAMALLETVPAGMERTMMLQQIGSSYARTDPERALEWASAMEPPSQDLMIAVVQGAVQSGDARLAARLIADPPPGVDVRIMTSMIGSLAAIQPDQAATLADSLLAQDNTLSRTALSNLVQNWVRRDQGGALSWLETRLDTLDTSMIGPVAQAMAVNDPVATARYVDELPPAQREAWIAQVAGPYASVDPAGAAGWLARYRGSAVYDTAYRQMVRQIAQNEPRAAADLVSSASADAQLGAARDVAAAWAQREPGAARDWALGLNDTAVRDEALSSLLPRIALSGQLDDPLLDAFNAPGKRNAALTQSLPILARSDPDRARELLDREITDPQARARIEEQIEMMSRSPEAVQPLSGVASGVFF